MSVCMTFSRLAGMSGLVFMVSASLALGQVQDRDLGVDKDQLELGGDADCNSLKQILLGQESGAQWLIGSGIPLYGIANSRSPLGTVDGAFAQVNCYAEVSAPSDQRVFVATQNFSSCGWIPRSSLLEEHRRENLDVFTRKSRSICEAARAMPLSRFCAELETIKDYADLDCNGIPPGLRAKGVLLGSTADAKKGDLVFRTAARGGTKLESRTFFSVMEIHALETNEAGAPVVLVGDGEGEMFGWVELRNLELWPTRLGLFYDAAGDGYLFSELKDMLLNWRTGTPEPNIRPGLGKEELEDYIHGKLQLLSYPIIRTIDPLTDPFADPTDPAYHEVIFLGKSGASGASDLLSQAEIARRVDALQKLNIMLVVDTTESMRPYLPLIRDGISQFINQYRVNRQNPALRLPELRLAVYAYSDFKSSSKTGLNDPVNIETLMPPRSIDQGSDLSIPLQIISAHRGLDDSVGLREEAALETVVQKARGFDEEGGWFEDGPRFVIHIADHGSRDKIDLAAVRRSLNAVRTKYVPLAIVTRDASESAKAARLALIEQAIETMKTFRANPTASDVAKVDLVDFQNKTPAEVMTGLEFVTGAIVASVQQVRNTGGQNNSTPDRNVYEVRERAASQIELSQRLLDEYGLDNVTDEVILQADTGYAPLVVRPRGIEQQVDWTYTVSLDPEQALVLEQTLSSLCESAGSPGQKSKIKTLIVRLAQAFSGDEILDSSDLRAVLSDVGELPGADESFLALPPRVLLDKIESTDPAVVNALRRDVCWISYHLTNMRAEIYARPRQLLWTGREFALKDGEEVSRRVYRYQPVIGAETVFLPSFFFVLPSIVESRERDDGAGGFFDR